MLFKKMLHFCFSAFFVLTIRQLVSTLNNLFVDSRSFIAKQKYKTLYLETTYFR